MAKPKINKRALDRQIDYFESLSKKTTRSVVNLHNNEFHNTPWALVLPKTPASRITAIRRLCFRYGLRDYHYPKNSQEYRAYKQHAYEYLSNEYKEELLPEDKYLQNLSDKGYFVKDNIQRMPIREVDGYLVALGIWADVPPSERRQLLYLYMWGPTVDEVHKYKGRKLQDSNRVQNEFCLVDIILQYPTMRYNEFRRRFGNEMPATTRGSFAAARSKLRKEGYNVPRLRPGMDDPVIIDPTKEYPDAK